MDGVIYNAAQLHSVSDRTGNTHTSVSSQSNLPVHEKNVRIVDLQVATHEISQNLSEKSGRDGKE